MSSPNPLQPQGALDAASAPKSRVRITVLTILGLHVVFIGGLLIQGCDKQGGASGAGASSNVVSSLPPLQDFGRDTNSYFTSFPGDARAAETSAPPAAPNVPTTFIPPADPVAAAPQDAVAGFGSPGTGTPSTPAQPIAASAPGATEHVIRKGDTLGDLAKKYGVTVQAILDANPNAKPRNLRLDEKIVIPPPTPRTAAAAPAPAAEGEVYVVKAGDTLSRIAKKFDVSVKQLRAANNLKGDRIVPKQRLVIPAKSPAAATPTPTAAAPTF